MFSISVWAASASSSSCVSGLNSCFTGAFLGRTCKNTSAHQHVPIGQTITVAMPEATLCPKQGRRNFSQRCVPLEESLRRFTTTYMSNCLMLVVSSGMCHVMKGLEHCHQQDDQLSHAGDVLKGIGTRHL